ncbi:hypothetical protein CLAFUW4_13608 [Fulvia fulva]|uniref:Uncharacterized protein n=1 Tax=Passalora fulva TaxID=5499 RepID=A0A9Q8PKJ4_PASFU|nr:uncharacterized protein CLAFUR5_13460 [Fulvia fulva]KAK4610252.1 hypothetical protein CLAFUR4_13611 [Fulvia fulva]UJO24216.1 hypothetical protein CLAFUR5_13460 [Fulvia fulva]WPV22271.1 hypothetical protein CLAFUW4_13608 [Fulvia fulva]WPV36695.1 hypothetical protein CLAFUW7_13616 [Fulvia fulva]
MAPASTSNEHNAPNGTADQHTATKACLMTVPSELRLEICPHYFPTFTFNTHAPASERGNFQAPLLNTCQLIRNEALPLYQTCI